MAHEHIGQGESATGREGVKLPLPGERVAGVDLSRLRNGYLWDCRRVEVEGKVAHAICVALTAVKAQIDPLAGDATSDILQLYGEETAE